MAMSQTMQRNKPGGFKDIAVQSAKEGAAWLRDYITAIKHGRLHPYTPMERKTREATRNEAWGPTGTILNELAEASFDSADCEIVFAVIELRLGYPATKWRNVYKALMLLDFLLTRGSSQCVRIARNELLNRLEDLQSFEYISQEGRDQGINVRHRAAALRALLRDDRSLQQERLAFQAKRKVYAGYAREDLDGGGSDHGYDRDDKESPGLGSIRRAASDGADSYSSPGDMGWSSARGGSRPAAAAASPAPPPNRAGLGRAGEMKGVSLADNVRHLAALKVLLGREENKNCADCVGGGGASRSSWASINNGVFICMTCAGIHRGLGVHVSVVRSTSLDTWLPEQVRFMAQTGNRVANAFFEARLDPAVKPNQEDREALRAFIFRKYCDREWADPSVSWPPTVRAYVAPGGERAPVLAADAAPAQAQLQPGGPSRVVPPINIWETARAERTSPGAFTSRTSFGPAASPGPASGAASLLGGFDDSAVFGASDSAGLSHGATWHPQRRLPPVRTSSASEAVRQPPAPAPAPPPAPNLMAFDDSPLAPPTPEANHASQEDLQKPAGDAWGQAQPTLAPPPPRAGQRESFAPAPQPAQYLDTVNELLSMGPNLMDGDLFSGPHQSLPEAMSVDYAFEAPQQSAPPAGSVGFSDIAQARAAAFGGFSDLYTSVQPAYAPPAPWGPPPTTVLQPRTLSFGEDGPSGFFSPSSSQQLPPGVGLAPDGDGAATAGGARHRPASSHGGSVASDDPYGLNLLNFDLPPSPVAPPMPAAAYAAAATPWTVGPSQNPYGAGAWPTGAGGQRPGDRAGFGAPLAFSPAPETGAYYTREAPPQHAFWQQQQQQPTPYTGWGAGQALPAQVGGGRPKGLSLVQEVKPRESPTRADLDNLMARQLDILKLSTARNAGPVGRRMTSMKEQRGAEGSFMPSPGHTGSPGVDS